MVLLMETNEEIPKQVGERVEVNGHRGTVLYIGPIPGTTGIWLGVDWDDPARGKHDGIHKSIRYFKARYETSGTFVRLEKATFGQNIISAIKQRYGGENKILDSNIVQEVQRAINAPFLMMVGFDKVAEMQSYQSLTIVGVREHQVNGAGDNGTLEEFCPRIIELDLGRNLINSWKKVADITVQLPQLQFLDLSENRLSHDFDLETCRNAFLNLEFLVLSKVEYTWNDIQACAIMWPQVEKLQVSFNKITSLSVPPANIFYKLKVLNIEGNSIVHWSEIEKLGSLPCLEVLNACNIGLTKIKLSSPNKIFPLLRFILLSRNYINNWESINELDKLPSLDELKFRDNPILSGMTRETASSILIARLCKLKMLNGQEITNDERKGAEYDYLKQNGKMWLESSSDNEARAVFLNLHPRYPALVKRYGEIDQVEFETKSTALKTNLINVNLVCGETVMIKKLPLVMTVRSLCGLAQRLFNISSVSLTLKSMKNPSLEVPLDNKLKQLSYYSVEQGDTIVVT